MTISPAWLKDSYSMLDYSLAITLHFMFLWLTNQKFSCVTFSGSWAIKSNFFTRAGMSLLISNKLMFFPIQVREPAPNYLLRPRALAKSDDWAMVAEWGVPYRHIIRFHHRELVFRLVQPSFWSEVIRIWTKDCSVPVSNPSVNANYGLLDGQYNA